MDESEIAPLNLNERKEESFSENSHPTLADAIEFVVEILDAPDAAFNQDLGMDKEGEEAEDDVEV